MRLREIFRTPGGQPRLLVPALVTLVITFVVGWFALRAVQAALPDADRADALAHTRRFADAEALYVRLLAEKPDAKLAIALLENHHHARLAQTLRQMSKTGGIEGMNAKRAEAVMPDEQLEQLLESLPPDVSLVARFWQGSTKEGVVAGLREALVIGAESEPPRPYYNHVLGYDAARHHDLEEAAHRYEREGLAYPERSEDIDYAVTLWVGLESWETVHAQMQDPRVAKAARPYTKYRIAVHDHDWASSARWLAVAQIPHHEFPVFVMSAIAALAWGAFLARLGKLGDRWKMRLPLYLASFVLGILSIAPTVALTAIEEAQLHLVETGDAMRDFLFFVFGVGLREEASKLLLFLPILLVLRKLGGKKGGDRLDVLVCGALVGLGFAAEENLSYLAQGNLHTGIGRFLTANFLHMSMTGILAASLDDFLRDRERYAAEFSRTTVLVVAMHGGYDFLLSHETYGGSYLAMTVFFFLVRMFLAKVDDARRRSAKGLTLNQAFVMAVAVVTGASAVYAVVQVGPVQGMIVMTEGLLGVAILIYAFVRTLRDMS